MGFAVDPAFIQSPEHRPKPTVAEARGIPLIDLSPLLLDHSVLNLEDDGVVTGVLQDLVAEVEAACREWGFLQVINHGVPEDILEKAWTASRSFFALPLNEKRQVRRDELNPLGYYDTEHTKNVRDWKEVFDFVVIEEPVAMPSSDEPAGGAGGWIELRSKWPELPPGFREVWEEYAQAVTHLAFDLLELIALSLNLPAKRLNGFFKDQTSFFRLNYYPPCPSPDLALGVGRHKDAGALTILAQDEVGGLDVRRRSDGEWVRVKPIPNSFIINVGDIIQVWSNDKYESAEHRVSVSSERERFSIPFFFNPAHYVMVKPLEELLKGGERSISPNYEEYNWGEFFKARKNSNFKKLEVENLQISHFKKVT